MAEIGAEDVKVVLDALTCAMAIPAAPRDARGWLWREVDIKGQKAIEILHAALHPPAEV